MTSMPPPVITIDGPAASGKGTVAQKLAAHLNFHLLDSGKLYRCVAHRARQTGADTADSLAAIAAEFIRHPATLTQALAAPDLSSDTIAAAASRVAAHAAVRTALIPLQRAARRPPGLVADGRDMGSVIFPDAGIKIFLTADVTVRARRRLAQLQKSGINAIMEDILADLRQRDERDSRRAVAPLHCPADAVRMDSTNVSADDIVFAITQLTPQRLGAS